MARVGVIFSDEFVRRVENSNLINKKIAEGIGAHPSNFSKAKNKKLMVGCDWPKAKDFVLKNFQLKSEDAFTEIKKIFGNRGPRKKSDNKLSYEGFAKTITQGSATPTEFPVYIRVNEAVKILPDDYEEHEDFNHRADFLPPLAILKICEVLDEGFKKYGEDSPWKSLPIKTHINHALVHVFKYLSGNKTEDHLSHAACRLLMELELELIGK